MTELRAYRRALLVVGSLSALTLCLWSVLILTWIPAQEFLHQCYRPFLWAGLVPGMVASGIFLCLHRPTKWLDPKALNSSGWVILIFLLYVRSGIALALQQDSLLWRGPGNALNSLGFAVAIDILLIFRVVSFLQFRISFRKAQAQALARYMENPPAPPATVTYIEPQMMLPGDEIHRGGAVFRVVTGDPSADHEAA